MLNKLRILGGMFMATCALHGATLINDPFTDGSRSNTFGGDPLGAVWYQSVFAPGAVTVVDDSGGIGTGNAMQLVPAVDFHKMIASFPAVTLASTNDSITVTFNYRFPTAPAAMGSGFRTGLYNSGGTQQTSDTTGTIRFDDVGFGFNTDPGTTAGTSTVLRMEGAGDDILGGSGSGAQVTLSSSTNGGSVASGTIKHTATLQITRLSNGNLQFTAQIDNATAATGSENAASVITYKFDEFAFAFGGTGYRPTILVDNVLVTINSSDTAPPTINAPAGGFTPLTLTTGAGGTVVLPDYTSQAVTSDNVGVTAVTQSPPAGTAVGTGTTAVTLTAHDGGGNTASTSFNVTVHDGTPPTISAPAGGFTPPTLLAGGGGTASLPDYTSQAVTSDNVGVTSVTQSPVAGSVQSVGLTAVTLTAHDAAGNTASTSFSVTVTTGAATEANDTFTDGSYTNTTGGDALGLVWYRLSTSNGTLAITSDTSVTPASNALALNATNTFAGCLGFFAPVTLGAAGNSLKVDFDVRFTSAPVNVSSGFRFGLYNSNGTRQTSDGNASTRYDDKGYGMATNAGLAGLNTFVYTENSASNNDILGGAAPGGLVGVGTSGASISFGTTSRHHVTLRLTRETDGSLQLQGYIDNNLAALGTVASTSVLTYTLDEVAIGNGGSTESFLIDNVRVVANNSPPTVTLTSPVENASTTAPATVHLAATASDLDGTIAKVEFYQCSQKIGEADSAPYALDLTNVGPGVWSYTAVATDDSGDSTTSAPVDIRVTGGTPDQFDTLRARWVTWVTGGTSYNVNDSNIATRLSSIVSAAEGDWTSMVTTGGNSRAYLWSDLTSTTVSAQLTSIYGRLHAMALAWATTGSSLQGNSALLTDTLSGLDWMYANRYNETLSEYDNWFDWEIGVPLALQDIAALLYSQFTPSQLMNQMRAIDHFTPDASRYVNDTVISTGGNLTWKAQVVTVRGVIVKDSSKIAAAQSALSALFPYVTTGDGFYADGSFIQHGAHPYNGGYGDSLLETLAGTLTLTNGSTWAITDPNLANFYQWIYASYQPFIYHGAFMDTVRGRAISRYSETDHNDGQGAVAAILAVAQFASATDAQNYKAMAKAWIQEDTTLNFLTTQSISAVLLAEAVLADNTITPTPDLVTHRHFAGMDRAVHWGSGYAFAVGMCSSRIYNYESINGENLHGWHLGDGATYLYDSDMDEYDASYWPTVNSYRLAGTTVDTQTLANAASESTLSPNSWAGGAEILGLYGSAGMQLQANQSTLTAYKSWFMFDNEIVALGSGITSTDNRTIETIIENRRLDNATSALVVNGVTEPTTLGWNATLTGVTWANLAATGGYVFPGGATINALRETRTGAWSDINTNGTTTTNTNNYATLWFSHGSNPSGAGYSYILLPNQTAAQTAAYAANPDAVILENTSSAHGVREQTLGITAAHFWQDATHSVGLVTVDKKSAVLVHEAAARVDVAISDPTQLNTGVVTVTLARAASALISSDPQITVLQLSPTIQFTANVNGMIGQSIKASFASQPGTLQFSSPTYSVNENGGTSTINVTRTGGTDGAVAVSYATADGTATAGSDYTATSGTLSWASGDSATKSFTIPITNDTLAEGNETVNLALSAPTGGASLGTSSTAVLTIVDNPIDGWRFANFGANANTPSIAGDTANPAGDGIPNLMKYALGLNPLIASRADLPTLSSTSGYVTLTFSRPTSATDITYIVEVSGGLLGAWATGSSYSITGDIPSNANTTQVSRTTTGGIETIVVRDNMLMNSATTRFIRLRVTQP